MAQSTSIVIGGTVAIDNIVTPVSSAEGLLGGSASYASLAATYFAKPVNLVGIVGQDFPKEHLQMLESRGVNLAGVEHSDGASFTWTGEYLDNMNERETKRVDINVLENWTVKLPDSIADSPLVVLANMSPENQLQMLKGCTAKKKFVMADTMDLWINIANEQLHEVLKHIDLLVINEGEARDFTGTSNLIRAGQLMREKGPKYVVVKLGEFGSILFGPTDEHHGLFRSAAFPLKDVMDPTGAGDTFLGGMAGYLASLGHLDFTFDDLRDGLVRGSILASFNCEDFSTRRLETLRDKELLARLELFREMTRW